MAKNFKPLSLTATQGVYLSTVILRSPAPCSTYLILLVAGVGIEPTYRSHGCRCLCPDRVMSPLSSLYSTPRRSSSPFY